MKLNILNLKPSQKNVFMLLLMNGLQRCLHLYPQMAIAKMEEVKLSAKEDDVMDMGMPIHVEKTKRKHLRLRKGDIK